MIEFTPFSRESWPFLAPPSFPRDGAALESLWDRGVFPSPGGGWERGGAVLACRERENEEDRRESKREEGGIIKQWLHQ